MTNDTTAIILDPSVAGTNHTGNTTENTWSVTFPNYTASGVSTCNSVVTSNIGEAHPEYNDVFTPGQATGKYCWCRMLNPVRSAWVRSNSYDGGASKCADACANSCGTAVHDNTTFRTAMYTSAGN